MNSVPFSISDAQQAADDWGFNCGPAALCAVLDLTPDEVRPLMGDFESKGYTNPTLMLDILRKQTTIGFKTIYRSDLIGPMMYLRHGLVRIQWGGSWTKPGVPMRVRYRQTHWVAMRGNGSEVFDVNAMCVGGWIGIDEWSEQLVPWLIRECVKKGDGTWWPTHGIEVVKLLQEAGGLLW